MLAVCLVAAPAFAEEHPVTPKAKSEGFSLIEEGMQLVMRGLVQEMQPALDEMGKALEEMMGSLFEEDEALRRVERLRDEKSVLIIPGDHFGVDGHLRISYGLPHDYLRDGLERIRQMLLELEPAKA